MNPSQLGRRLAALAVAATTLGTMAAAAAPAQASLLSGGACPSAATSQPFAPWNDTNDYGLAPGGAFSGQTTNWSLTNRATVVSGGEPWNVSGTSSAASVDLPAGASAQSPFACVNARYPTFRFFAKNGGMIGTVLVQVVYQVPVLGQVALPVGTFLLSNHWQPSAAMLTGSGLPASLTGDSSEVALRFTSLTGDSRIDDVFIDPRMRG